MTELILFAILAILLLAASFALARSGQIADPTEIQESQDLAQGLWDGSCLSLAERIFDPADFKWLRDELYFPQAAQVLARHRKELAVNWLKALRSSFKNFVRSADPTDSGTAHARDVSGWQLLWLTLRFHFLVSYAILIVRLFGPYHRLVPYFGWLRSLQQLKLRNVSIGVAGVERVP
jgi:hypothetical protein